LSLSLPWVLMQMPPQSSSPGPQSTGGEKQELPEQNCPSGQGLPQEPQFAASLCTSVQNPPQSLGAVSGQAQPPPAQKPPLGQALSQIPQ
jgi:hypothetical protein